MKKISHQPYVCRKCNRSDFKKWMEFTKHLRTCKGPVAAPPAPNGKPEDGILAELADISRMAGDLKTSVDAMIKRLK